MGLQVSPFLANMVAQYLGGLENLNKYAKDGMLGLRIMCHISGAALSLNGHVHKGLV